MTGRPVELVEITTYGDVSREDLAQIGGTGVFVTALREALLRGEVDFAVHSLKDLPTAQPDDLVLAAIPEREDPRDVAGRPRRPDLRPSCRDGARIGTGSPRRMAQLNAYARPRAAHRDGADPRQRRHPDRVRATVASWTRSCWPRPGSTASAGSTR